MADGDIEGWRSIPIQHQELDPDFQIVPQQRVSAYLGAGGGRTFRVPAEPKQVILDGDMLLDECHESYPGDVYGSNLRSKNINGVAAEDAPFFISLASLDLSDNAVMFEHTAPFPALRQLVLQCNGISAFTVPAEAFSRLERLDLSFNHVPEESVAVSAALLSRSHALVMLLAGCGGGGGEADPRPSLKHRLISQGLAALPNLLELDLSSNSLLFLPDMGGFVKLQKLNAGGNKLRDEAVFDNLAAIPNLVRLCLHVDSSRATRGQPSRTSFPVHVARGLIARRFHRWISIWKGTS